MAADTGAVDAAILAALRADAALVAVCPGGVFYGIAPPEVTAAFVIVQRLSHGDNDAMYTTAAGETFVYLCKAVVPGTSSDPARSAALRIRAVLDDNATLAPVGYALQRAIAETASVREVEVDEQNPDRRVQHWGGYYEVTLGRR